MSVPSEITNFTTSVNNYNTEVSSFLSGTSSTCPHFLNVIPNISSSITEGILFSHMSSGQGSSYGSMADFVYEVIGMGRVGAILSATKASYYTTGDAEVVSGNAYNTSSAAVMTSYIVGSNVSQGVIS